MHARRNPIFEAPDESTARTLLASFVADYQARAPGAVKTLERSVEDATAVLALPALYRKRLRTTKGVERLNAEIRRRERVIRILPNCTSVLRLVGALLMEQDAVWTTGKRYFDMIAYWQWHDTHPRQASLFHTGQEAAMPQPVCGVGSTRHPNCTDDFGVDPVAMQFRSHKLKNERIRRCNFYVGSLRPLVITITAYIITTHKQTATNDCKSTIVCEIDSRLPPGVRGE